MAIVYIHRRNDIQDAFLNVFYVGIGKNTQRAYDKRKNDRSDFWHKIVAKSGYAIEITHVNLCWEEACAIEKYLICFYGRRNLNLGNLCNLTDGGEGVIGHIDTPEQLEKRIQTAIIVNNRDGAREKMSIALKKATSSLEHRKKMSQLGKEASNRPEVKQKRLEKYKILLQNPEFKEKHRLATKMALNNPEIRKKISEGGKIAQNKPEVKEKNLIHLKKLHENKKLLEKRNNSIKKAWEEKNKLNITLSIKRCENPRCNKDFEQKRSFQKYCCYNCGGSVYKQKKRTVAKKLDNLSKYI